MKTSSHVTPLLAAAFALPLLFGSIQENAQGCLAAHSNSSMQGCLTGSQATSGHLFRHHPVPVEVDWRSFSSFRHFVGEKEQTQRAVLGNQIKNHQNLYNITVETQLSPRWSANIYVPVLQGSRNQKYAPYGIYDIAGVGD